MRVNPAPLLAFAPPAISPLVCFVCLLNTILNRIESWGWTVVGKVKGSEQAISMDDKYMISVDEDVT